MTGVLKPFVKIALPHDDVIQNTFSMNIFAADLWEAYKGNAPVEYSNPRVFFSRTYLTKGLSHLIDIVGSRILNGFGDPVIQIQTPFGGGKTHALITLMHKARDEWKAKTVVIVGTVPDVKESRLWEMIEEQLTGKVELLKSVVSPGKDKLRKLLSEHQPLLILMDEALEYLIRASGIYIGESTLASQTLAFMQELSEVVSSLPRAVLVYTLPSSALEHYDENGEKLFQQIQKIVGRVERVLSPIEDEEVSMVIRRRLFKSIDEQAAEEVVDTFVRYLEEKELLKKLRIEPREYRERFLRSYPFQPEVIDVLYHKWGSFPDFQRTRGVLRLLALVVHSMINSDAPYISLADFDLSNQEIRQELVKFAGQEFNSIIAQDISSPDSGSKRVDKQLGTSNLPLKLGTRTATVIFMNSFSGGTERGAYVDEIVLSATTLHNEPSVIHEALSKLSTELFYLQTRDGKYYFHNQPNLNRIHVNKMENISENEVEKYERELLERHLDKAEIFRVYIWEELSENIDDTKTYKLIILKNRDEEVIKRILERKGQSLRIYKNTIFFLVPDESERFALHNSIRKLLAWKRIKEDSTLNLREEDLKEIERNIATMERDIETTLPRVYRTLLVPAGASEVIFDEHRLGVPVYGRGSNLEDSVYDELKSLNILVEKLDYRVIVAKFLKDRDFISVSEILESCYRTPGEIRLLNESVLEQAIRSGVDSDAFCVAFQNDGSFQTLKNLEGILKLGEVFIVKKEKCVSTQGTETATQMTQGSSEDGTTGSDNEQGKVTDILPPGKIIDQNFRKEIFFERLKLSRDNVHEILRLAKSLLEHFQEVSISIRASRGQIPEEKIRELYNQLKEIGIVVEER